LKIRESLTTTTTAATTSKQVIITFYYQKDDKLCPDCNSAKKEWDAFVKDNNKNSVNGYSIVCNTMDCSNDQDPNMKNALRQNNIKKLPAVKMLVNGKSLPYSAKITKSNLETFINRIFNLLS
jgi:thiol-disulfide isomerase/thioredoxin